ncbi:cation:proton antiporter [Streptomyces bacillaris]|uniref:Cation:proton antiporter n=1 Tax=Streptomyces cavourensis TaxID=67258 RepID=A0AAD0VFK6_9ACTN|nr:MULTISPECIES: cation:proton antiporter [Streptomyces]NUW24710.1 cation:proton antiporter [Streptomyces roseoviolaceus]ALC28496.1 potassium transporter [Streptomyces sp. CFMR 7]AXI72996.1 cation:proton antiporter [Streptomyces cavourensis]MBH0244971.1 cation:proton antiporter [Streptomyces cavourensis]MCR8942715.1 cation:proton antiporter [Streptomyces sp. OUCMDZ-4982]
MAAPADPLPDLLIAIPVVILLCKAGARLVRGAGQPPVVGEIAVGLLLGPSFLGWLWPEAQAWLFPPASLPYLGLLGNLGLLIFMFLVGHELQLGSLRSQTRTAAVVSLVSIALPLGLGTLLALGMYGAFAPEGVERLPFVLFIAVAMSITAFPVMARILSDRGMYRTRVGVLALACAAFDDVAAWCLLAAVVAVSTAGSPMEAVTTALSAVAFCLFMVVAVRPLLARLTDRAGRTSTDSLVLVLLFSGLCLSALATDLIGVHALFGAFLFGAVTPRGSRVIEHQTARLRAFAVPVLLPLFFVTTGLRADVGLLATDPVQWLWAGAVLAVAVLAKWGGGTGAARLSGQSWRDAMSIGTLMNCRGLTELIVLNVGLGLGVIGQDLFTILVLMALITTAVTSPVLNRLRKGMPEEEPPAGGRADGEGAEEAAAAGAVGAGAAGGRITS